MRTQNFLTGANLINRDLHILFLGSMNYGGNII